MKRILLATLAGGVIAFFWSAIVHMNFGYLGLSVMGDKEAPVVAALKANLDKPGLYFFPGMDMSKKMTRKKRMPGRPNTKPGRAVCCFIIQQALTSWSPNNSS